MSKDGKEGNNTGVYVKGLPSSFVDDDLHQLFAASGKIQRITIPRDTNGRPRGVALLEFEAHEQAAAAVLLNDTLVGGKSLHVSFKVKCSETAADGEMLDDAIRMRRRRPTRSLSLLTGYATALCRR